MLKKVEIVTQEKLEKSLFVALKNELHKNLYFVNNF